MRLKKRKITVDIYDDNKKAGLVLAEKIKKLIVERQQENKTCLIGISAGRSPLVVLDELRRMHKLGQVNFHNVYFLLSDEFFPCTSESHSCLRFLNVSFLSKIDIPKENIISPLGLITLEEAERYCYAMPQLIKNLGGIDITILGIGQEGVIGFNEPGTAISSATRLVHLNHKVHPEIEALSNNLERLPDRAISLGIRTLLKSKAIYLVAWGEKKSKAIYEAIESPVNANSPASYLQFHNGVTAVLDRSAARYLIENVSLATANRHQKHLIAV